MLNTEHLENSETLDLAKARHTLQMADWEVSREEKQLARKTIDRLTGNAWRKGYKGQ